MKASDVGAVVINFKAASMTERSLRSLDGEGLRRVVLVDNASTPEEREILTRVVESMRTPCALVPVARNVGFAAGANIGIEALLGDAAVEGVLLLNNDAELLPGAAAQLATSIRLEDRVSLAGGRVMSMRRPGEIDSLGIALYQSCLASNRMRDDDVYLGPTGGCALYSRVLLDDLRESHGHWFDEDFFCYAEDTDLAVRSLLRGHVPAFVEEAVALHEGQASSGGGFNDFVLYHGIRNSVWMLIKCIPATILLSRLPLVVALHAAIVLRHSVGGRPGTVWRLYRDALRGLPAMWRKRRIVQRTRSRAGVRFSRYMTPVFYEREFLRRAIRALFGLAR